MGYVKFGNRRRKCCVKSIPSVEIDIRYFPQNQHFPNQITSLSPRTVPATQSSCNAKLDRNCEVKLTCEGISLSRANGVREWLGELQRTHYLRHLSTLQNQIHPPFSGPFSGSIFILRGEWENRHGTKASLHEGNNEITNNRLLRWGGRRAGCAQPRSFLRVAPTCDSRMNSRLAATPQLATRHF